LAQYLLFDSQAVRADLFTLHLSELLTRNWYSLSKRSTRKQTTSEGQRFDPFEFCVSDKARTHYSAFVSPPERVLLNGILSVAILALSCAPGFAQLTRAPNQTTQGQTQLGPAIRITFERRTTCYFPAGCSDDERATSFRARPRLARRWPR